MSTSTDRNILALDNASNADAKVIRQLRIRSGGWIDGLALDFTDGTSTPWHGGQGGTYQTFTLQSGEDFTWIRVTANEKYITGLCFGTSKGDFQAFSSSMTFTDQLTCMHLQGGKHPGMALGKVTGQAGCSTVVRWLVSWALSPSTSMV